MDFCDKSIIPFYTVIATRPSMSVGRCVKRAGLRNGDPWWWSIAMGTVSAVGLFLVIMSALALSVHLWGL